MGNAGSFTQKWNGFRDSLRTAANTGGSVYSKIKNVLGFLIMSLYRIRALFMAIPVAFAALKLAAYNMQNLPEQVGLNLQSTGEFTMYISRSMAVMGPLVLTGGCLVMMFFSRKAMYPWAVSFFTLILPILLLVSNIYPM